MKERKSENKRFEKNINIFIIVFIIFFFFVAIISYPYEKIKQENLQLKNEKADAFCKSQSYAEIISGGNITRIVLEKPKFHLSSYVNNKIIYADIIEGKDVFTPSKEELIILSEYVIKDIYNDVTSYGTYIHDKLVCDSNEIVRMDYESRNTIFWCEKEVSLNFETGYYNQTDNSFYCQAEKICTNFRTCDVNNNGLCKDSSMRYEEAKKWFPEGKINEFCSLGYQKVEKFPYK